MAVLCRNRELFALHNFCSACLVAITFFCAPSFAVNTSLLKTDRILKLLEMEISPSNAVFILDVRANSKIPFLGFSLYSKSAVDGDQIPLKVVARPDLTTEEALSKGLIMYEFIPSVDYVKKFSWTMQAAHDLVSHSGVSYLASVDTGSVLLQKRDYISIGQGDQSLNPNRHYPANQSFMPGTEESVTYLTRTQEGEIKLASVNLKYYRRDDSFPRSYPAGKGYCALVVQGQ